MHPRSIIAQAARWLPVVSLWIALGATPRVTRAQVFEVQGGGSSLYQGYGGALNVWGERFEGNVGLGYLDGFRFSVFFKQLVGRDTLRLGNDAIPVRFATDVFGGSHTIFAQGAGIHRAQQRSSLYAFVWRECCSPRRAPFVNALQLERRDRHPSRPKRSLSPNLRLKDQAFFLLRKNFCKASNWKTGRAWKRG